MGKELLAYYADTFATEPPMGRVHIKIGVGIDLKVSKATKGVKVKDVIEAIYSKYGKKFVCLFVLVFPKRIANTVCRSRKIQKIPTSWVSSTIPTTSQVL
jgi:hypothetical protein